MAKNYSKVAQDLVRGVEKAAAMAHAPYSRIRVGAVLYAGPDRIYRGMNIENSSYSLTICAERVALYHALAVGEKDFRLLVVYSPERDFIIPCGACLQVLDEWAPGIVIATMNRRKDFKFHPLKTLLPRPFRINADGH
jgi:cytidine deaminase